MPFYKLALCLYGLIYTTTALNAQDIVLELDFEQKTETIKLDYVDKIDIKLKNINRLDYSYEVTIEAIAPAPKPEGELPPFPVGQESLASGSCDYDKANKLLLERLVTFGQGPLEQWDQRVNDLCPLSAQIIRGMYPKGIDTQGTIELDSDAIIAVLKKTNAGGALLITVQAKIKNDAIHLFSDTNGTPTFTPVVFSENLFSTEEQKKEYKKHTEKRVYRIEFNTPKSIRATFGPYISFLENQSFQKIKNTDPNAMPEDLVISLDDNSDLRYGIAAFWNASFPRGDNFGVSWGVAYTAQKEIDEAIQGLLGFYWNPNGNNAHFNFGISLGQTTNLADGIELGQDIGSTEEIPVTTSLEAAAFVGISFRFNRD